jgi:hypothetical protein
MSVILLVDGLHELYAGTAGGGQVKHLIESRSKDIEAFGSTDEALKTHGYWSASAA